MVAGRAGGCVGDVAVGAAAVGFTAAAWVGVVMLAGAGSLGAPAGVVGSRSSLVSALRMRIDWPMERAKSGIFFAPNSNTSTPATINQWVGLSAPMAANLPAGGVGYVQHRASRRPGTGPFP